jgi:hypothetical protein
LHGVSPINHWHAIEHQFVKYQQIARTNAVIQSASMQQPESACIWAAVACEHAAPRHQPRIVNGLSELPQGVWFSLYIDEAVELTGTVCKHEFQNLNCLAADQCLAACVILWQQ